VSFFTSIPRILIAACIALLVADFASAQDAGKAKVFYAMETSSLAPRRVPNPAVVRRMVDNLVCASTGKPNPAAAWASLVKASDRVGIKVAASGGAVSGTHPAVVKAIAAGLVSAGIQPSNIIVWDRNLADLLAAGYSRNDPLYRLRWVDTATGYDKKSQVTAPVIGRLIWGDSAFGDRAGSRMEDLLAGGEQLSSTSYYAKVLSQEVDKVINVPSLTDSFLTGVNGALANMTLPNLDNWRRFTRSPDFGDPYLAEIYADAMIRDKVVLTILDALVLQYAGGPFPNPGFLTEHHTIFVSHDPVAVDATAVRLLNENRILSRLPSLDKMTLWLQSASAIDLGKNSEEDIELIRIGARPEPPAIFKNSAPPQPETR
jgi:uncharacterized protein (DUF362 family)